MKAIHQSEAGECGLACLAMVADHYGQQLDIIELRQRFRVSTRGANLSQLIQTAATLHLSARPVRLELEDIPQLRLPAILHWNLNHFVILDSIYRDLRGRLRYKIFDPVIGEAIYTQSDISRHFTGIAVELSPSREFKQTRILTKFSIREFLGPISGMRKVICQLIILSLALELFALFSPLFNQFVIDELLAKGDRDYLAVLAYACASVLLTQVAISWARNLMLAQWSSDLGMHLAARAFSHLIRLRVAFFDKRPLGDLVSKFGSTSTIEASLTTVSIESIIDGIMASMAIAMLAAYSIKLCLISASSVLLYCAIRYATFTMLRRVTHKRILLSAKESSYFLETLRAISAIKLFGKESERRASWLNIRQDVINSDLSLQKLNTLCKISSATLLRFQALLLIYFGALLVIEGHISIGMLAAIGIYATTFTGRLFHLTDIWVEIKLLTLHTGRLSDLFAEPTEQVQGIAHISKNSVGQISLRNVGFRYSESEPWIFRGLDLTISLGQSLALTGPSGSGKTTLSKIILGLLEPVEGMVFVDDTPIQDFGPENYRSLIGTVMQDDFLLAGSLLENITFFDSTPDYSHAENCAKQAEVHDEIIAMPLGYQTMVGESGVGLSGGQRQRILLARALYKRPAILMLDEATSHLDINNERKISSILERLSLTRLMIAHRPETILTAEKIFQLKDGILQDVTAHHNIDRNDFATEDQ